MLFFLLRDSEADAHPGGWSHHSTHCDGGGKWKNLGVTLDVQHVWFGLFSMQL